MKNYLRYKLTNDGISPRVFPGQKNALFDANSDEHDEYGFSTEESSMRTKMMDKRFRKIQNLEKEVESPKIYGEKKAPLTFISWGSTKGPILEALRETDKKIRFVHFNFLYPFPKKNFLKAIKGSKKLIVLENNKTGQLSSLIKENSGIETQKFLKYDGRPFWPEEIKEFISKI